MKKIKNTKLALHTETIKTLDAKQLEHIPGGQMPATAASCFKLGCVGYTTHC